MEQVNPNALGAPAEGFGQTVSFAFDPRGEVPQQQGQQAHGAGRTNSNVVGGMNANAHAMNPNAAIQPVRADPTTALLLRVGDEILKPALDKQRTEEYVGGMQRAMAGEALTDIVEQVPWYAKLFGDTPAIEGARAYTAHSKVNSVMADQVANMGNLEALSGPEAAAHFTKVVNTSLTGDAGADGVIMKGLADQLPGLMKAQAKAHYGYNQGRAMAAYSDNMLTGANTLQGMGQLLADGKVGPDDMAKANAAFVQAVMPPEGLDTENGGKTITDAMRRMAQAGQFHAIAALKASGSYVALDDKQVAQVEGAVVAAANKHRNAYAMTFSAAIGALKSDARHLPGGMTPDAIQKKALAMNAKYQQMTGSPLGLFNSDEVADMMAGTFDAIKAAHLRVETQRATQSSKDATVNDKATAKLMEDGERARRVAAGEVVFALAQWTAKEVNATMTDLMVQNPKQAPTLLMTAWINGGVVHEETKQHIQSMMRQSGGQEVPPDKWFAAVSLFNTMRSSEGGLEYAVDYFGEDYAKRMQRASRMLGENVADNPNSAGIYRATMNSTDSTPTAQLTKEEVKSSVKAVTGTQSNAAMRLLTGAINLTPSTLALVQNHVQAGAEEWMSTGISSQEAISLSLNQALRGGKLELVGGYGIVNADYREGGKPPPTLRSLASTPDHPIGSDTMDGYFKDFIEAKGVGAGDTRLVRMGTKGGAVRFAMTVVNDGETRTHTFSSDEWRAYARSKDAQRVAQVKRDGRRTAFPTGGQAGIYDNAAAGRADSYAKLFEAFTRNTMTPWSYSAAAAAKQPK